MAAIGFVVFGVDHKVRNLRAVFGLGKALLSTHACFVKKDGITFEQFLRVTACLAQIQTGRR